MISSGFIITNYHAHNYGTSIIIHIITTIYKFITYIWVNYHISLTWILRPFGDDFPKKTMDSRVENREPLWNHCTASPHHRCDRVTDLELIFRQGLLDELEVLRHELPDASCRSNIREKKWWSNICKYMYVYMYIYIYVYMYICICIYGNMYECIYVSMYICIYVYVYMEICMNVYMYLCIYVQIVQIVQILKIVQYA